MKVAFFCSNHGFGHILREQPVMEELLSRGHEVYVVCGEIQCNQLNSHKRLSCITYDTDVGIKVIPGTLELDKEATQDALRNYMDEYDNRILFGERVIKEYAIDKVVVDIVPWALDAAKNCGVETYLMTSFTWIEQYEGFVKEQIVDRMKASFQKADYILYYAMANENVRAMLGHGEEVGFVCRRFDENRILKIREHHSREMVFFSIGVSNFGLDFDIDVSDLPYDFICTEGFRLVGKNVTYLPRETDDVHNYIKAADYCISKPGWTTVSELMVAGKRFALLERPDVPEDTLTIGMLEKMNAVVAIGVDELRDMKNVMEKLTKTPLDNCLRENNYKKVADILERK